MLVIVSGIVSSVNGRRGDNERGVPVKNVGTKGYRLNQKKLAGFGPSAHELRWGEPPQMIVHSGWRSSATFDILARGGLMSGLKPTPFA